MYFLFPHWRAERRAHHSPKSTPVLNNTAMIRLLKTTMNPPSNDIGNPKMPPRKRRQQELRQQQQAQHPSTPAEIANSYITQELGRKSRMSFFLRGLSLTLFVCIALTLFFHFYSRADPLIEPKRIRYRVVVTLGPSPSRLLKMKPLLSSLIEKQSTTPPAMVYLVLPRKGQDGVQFHYKIPPFVEKYVEQKKIAILTPNVDCGNATKLYATMRYEKSAFATRIIYMDAGHAPVDRNYISNYAAQSARHPNAAISFEGAVLQNYFRKLDYVVRATKEPIKADVLEGPAIMVQRRFFNVEAFKELVQNAPQAVQMADKFLLAAHLEEQNVVKWVVPTPFKGGNAYTELGRRNYVQSAHYLQQQLGIWRGFKFHNYKRLSDSEKDAINCDLGDKRVCRSDYQNILQELDSKSESIADNKA